MIDKLLKMAFSVLSELRFFSFLSELLLLFLLITMTCRVTTRVIVILVSISSWILFLFFGLGHVLYYLIFFFVSARLLARFRVDQLSWDVLD